jgi:hypothetical protein
MQVRAARSLVKKSEHRVQCGYDIQFKAVYINIFYQNGWIPIYFGRTKPKLQQFQRAEID